MSVFASLDSEDRSWIPYVADWVDEYGILRPGWLAMGGGNLMPEDDGEGAADPPRGTHNEAAENTGKIGLIVR
jgi:hypothetical protein